MYEQIERRRPCGFWRQCSQAGSSDKWSRDRQIDRHPSINNGPVQSRVRNIGKIISFPHIHPSVAYNTFTNAWNCSTVYPRLLSLSLPSLSFFSPLLFSSLDGTPRLRGKSDIFRHGIWRSNDARAKLSTSIRLFVPNWPSATPGSQGPEPTP